MNKKNSRRLNIIYDPVRASPIVDDPVRASPIVDDYIRYHEKYEKVYGKNRSIVLMQVGSFHEAYATDSRGPKLFTISDILNIVCTRKDKSQNKISEKNPYMLGFPSVSLSKFLKILIDYKYTVIVIDQTTPPPNPTREVTGIYSPSTFIENISIDNKYLMIIYIEINQSINTSTKNTIKNNISIGMSCIDVSTGFTNYYETHGTGLVDENEAIEECQRYYHFFRPVELIIYEINNNDTNNKELEKATNKQSENKILNKLDIIPNQTLFFYRKINPSYTKLSYQNMMFKKVYTNIDNLISPIENLELEKYPYAIISLIIGLDYIHQHNNNLLKELHIPQYFNEHKYMILGNNAQYQLNIVDYYNYEIINTKYQSLNDVINSCCTPMGKRKLKMRLCSPFTNITVIQNYYDITDKILVNNIDNSIRDNLKGILDIERLLRKIVIKYIQPYELHQIYESFTNIVNLINTLINSCLKEDLFVKINKKSIKLFNSCINYIEDNFDLQKLKRNNLIEIKENIYNVGIHKDIDDLIYKIDYSIGFMEKLAKKLDTFIINNDKSAIMIKHNDRDGYYLLTTKTRGIKLKAELNKLQILDLDENNSVKISDLVFKDLNNNIKISYPELDNYSDELESLYRELDILIKEKFCLDIKKWYETYSIMLNKIINIVVEYDIIANNAFIAKKYHYTKPVIVQNKESFIEAQELRHPIIERLIDYEYTPHDIKLDNQLCGNLIYGVNSCGKSSLMKAVGLNLIMAQCGLYVPSSKFEYNIFTSLYTRISGNDNLFKGQSSFIVEMNELKCILKKSNANSLIIGDEICRGTEYLSGNALVGSTILRLIENKSKFLFATHLHDLPNLTKIKEQKSIKFFHLSVERKGDELYFNRKIEEGTGEEIYGITIAKYILDDPVFINSAIELKNELLEKKNINYKLVNDKKSLYNKEFFVDKCYMCSEENSKLETHHINFQKDFKKINGSLIKNDKIHIIKDDKSNLIVLCEKCHDNIHTSNLNFYKIKTSNGTKLST
jgi:DNA mismatch repair protein MutS